MIVTSKEEKRFPLQTDPEGNAFIIVAQASFGESRRLADLTATQRQLIQNSAKGERMAIEQDFNYLEERAHMIYLTAREIGGIQDENGQELFEFVEDKKLGRRRPASLSNFMAAIDILPEDVVNEMHHHVLSMNPQWLPKSKRGSESD